MTKIAAALQEVTSLGLDSDVIIYFVSAMPPFYPVTLEVFRRIGDGRFVGVTSTVTLTEGLVHPIQNNDLRLQREYRALLLNSNLRTVPIDSVIAERAAELRARYNLRTPDALQVAAALEAGCDAFLTNNGKHFRRVTELQVIVLSGLEL